MKEDVRGDGLWDGGEEGEAGNAMHDGARFSIGSNKMDLVLYNGKKWCYCARFVAWVRFGAGGSLRLTKEPNRSCKSGETSYFARCISLAAFRNRIGVAQSRKSCRRCGFAIHQEFRPKKQDHIKEKKTPNTQKQDCGGVGRSS